MKIKGPVASTALFSSSTGPRQFNTKDLDDIAKAAPGLVVTVGFGGNVIGKVLEASVESDTVVLTATLAPDVIRQNLWSLPFLSMSWREMGDSVQPLGFGVVNHNLDMTIAPYSILTEH